MTKRTIVVLGLALPLAPARAAEAGRKFPATGLRALDVRTERGLIAAEAGGMDEVAVAVVDFDPQRCEIAMARRGDRLHAEAKTKPGPFWRPRCNAGFRIRVPRGLPLDAASGSGGIEVAALAGPLVLRAGSGGVRLDGVAGDVTAELGSGSVTGRVRAKRVAVRCGSGDVRLRWDLVPAGGEAQVKAGSGSVELAFPAETALRTDLRSGSGRVRNEFGEAASAALRIVVKTGSGNIAVVRRPAG